MRTYTNPVYPRDFPDPFALRFNGRYYAYATGVADDGRCFPMLSSPDLLRWEPHGGALEPLGIEGAEEYWAPEVAYSEGRFYLYYATGHAADPDHHLRLAVADHPLGPWKDAGRNLTPGEIFAIDAHPFRDPRDGHWYLYYARDVLEPPYAGTGLAVDRLLSMDRLEGNPRNVLRPYAAWQVFELQRAIKQGLDWYTIEGPFVLQVEGRYVCFYSGGRWENPNYGVGYAFAGSPLGPWTDEFNEGGPLVLTTVPGRVIGPGHNSVVIGPDLITPYLVYHGWDPDCTARYPRIDPLEWVDGHPRCEGPSSEPRPAPAMPDMLARFEAGDPGPEWEGAPAWHSDQGLHASCPEARLSLREPQPDFIAETAIRSSGPPGAGIAAGELQIRIEPKALHAGDRSVPLPAGFRHDAWHRLLLRRQGGRLAATVDEFPTIEVSAPDGPAVVSLFGGPGTCFSHFALTRLAGRGA
jgi:GH43 family beta-xylosidase